MANKADQIYSYSIPINEPDGENGSVTMFVVRIQDNLPHRRLAILRRAVRANYGLSRKQAAIGIREMKFDNIPN